MQDEGQPPHERQPPNERQPPFRLFLKHIYMSTTEHDMVEQMNYLRATDGLYNVYLVKRGTFDPNKSINAFLSYQTEDQCMAAMEILNGSYLGGLAKYPLEVDLAVPRKTQRYFAQPEPAEHTQDNFDQHPPLDELNKEEGEKEPDLRRPVTPPKAPTRPMTPPMAPMMAPMHHIPGPPVMPPGHPPPPSLHPMQHLQPYPLMPFPPPPPVMGPMGFVYQRPPPFWMPPQQPFAPASEDWMAAAKSKASMGSKAPKPQAEGGDSEGDEDLQTWLQSNMMDGGEKKSQLLDDGYGSVEDAEAYMLQKKDAGKKEKAEKAKEKPKEKSKENKKETKAPSEKKEKGTKDKKKKSRSRSRSKAKKVKEAQKDKKSK